MPPPNASRRAALADAAIALIADGGLHGLTHRALDKRAGMPDGTASNYFPTRDALLLASAQRVVELHHQDMARTAPERGTRRRTLADAVELLTQSLVDATTVHRSRYIAVFDLQGEIRRRPELAASLGAVLQQSAQDTSYYHRELGLPIAPESVPALQALYGGALLALLHQPAESITALVARPLAEAMVYGLPRRRPGR